jgi:hypothetical protein
MSSFVNFGHSVIGEGDGDAVVKFGPVAAGDGELDSTGGAGVGVDRDSFRLGR